MRSRHPALITGLVLAGLFPAALPGPVAAANVTTRWVDDDGHAGSSSCSGTKTAYKSIRSAVNASNASDVVKVCPGSYTGKVTITGARNGLVLKAATTTKPYLKAKVEYFPPEGPLVTINGVANVTVRGLRLRPATADSGSDCTLDTGIRAVGATNVILSGNDIRPYGGGVFCGLRSGIVASGGTTGLVTGNVIRDYKENGIDVAGAGTNVTVESNSVTFQHDGIDPIPAGGPAVFVRNGAVAGVRFDTLSGPTGVGPAQLPHAGVRLDGSGNATVVRGNTIARFASGIEVTHANGGTLRDNVVTGGQVGVNLLDADAVQVYGNTSSGATVHALFVEGGQFSSTDAQKSTHANVHGNDFRSSSNGAQPDCRGESTPASYVVTTNTFADNVDTTSSPAAMCEGSGPA
jgi:parallel beta-helix repeat protein